MKNIRSIIVPHDFSEHAQRALEMATELAELLDAELHLLHVIQPPAYAYGSELYAVSSLQLTGNEQHSQHLYEHAKQQLDAVVENTPGGRHPTSTHVIEGTRIADAIDQAAEHLHADLIVMGTHGRTGIAHLLLGSVAEATLRQAPCPVLTVPLCRARVKEAGMSMAAHHGLVTQNA